MLQQPLLLLLITCSSWLAGIGDAICTREICTYHFNIDRARTMTYVNPSNNVTYNVRLNGTRLQVHDNDCHFKEDYPDNDVIGSDVSPDGVITADGYGRNVITINGMFPGPNIEVMEGSQVELRVHNRLRAEAVTIHFHGLPLKNNVWMDGVPFVTQCPIQPSQTFTYRVRATPAGTHWYHSHVTAQRLDGLYGLFIVHQVAPVLPQVALSVTDWVHEDGETLRVFNPYEHPIKGAGNTHLHPKNKDYGPDGVELTSLAYGSALINGRGRWTPDRKLPLTMIYVTPGIKHVFRLVHTGAEYPFQVSIDEHTLTVVASDGETISPIEVDYLVILPGENFDFEVTANQKPGNYWLRAWTMTERIGGNYEFLPDTRQVLAKVIYQDAGPTDEPNTKQKMCSSSDRCKVFNCPFPNFPNVWFRDCIGMEEAQSTHPVIHEYGLQDDSVLEYFLNMAFIGGSNVNGRRFVTPNVPLHRGGIHHAVPCDTERCPEDMTCHCTHILDLPYNRTVQLVVSSLNPGTPLMAHHTVHLHGHHFAMLKMGYPSVYNKTTGRLPSANTDIKCDTTHCNRPRWNSVVPSDLNLINPAIKETAIVPAGGYVVMRFRTLNPGYWMLHCHQELHALEGMDMVLAEATDRLPRVPPGFPECTNFDWSERQFHAYELELKERMERDAAYVEVGPERSGSTTSITVEGILVGLFLSVPVLVLLVYVCSSKKLSRHSREGYLALETNNNWVDDMESSRRRHDELRDDIGTTKSTTRRRWVNGDRLACRRKTM